MLFKAFQIPGWVNEIKPTMITLKSGLRYHLVNLETCFCLIYTSSLEFSPSLVVSTASFGLDSLAVIIQECANFLLFLRADYRKLLYLTFFCIMPKTFRFPEIFMSFSKPNISPFPVGDSRSSSRPSQLWELAGRSKLQIWMSRCKSSVKQGRPKQYIKIQSRGW